MLEIGVLGLLKDRPMHGYELKKRLNFLLGHFWQVSYGSLYPALKRLEKRGAIERFFSSKEKSKRRNVYRLTEEGEQFFQSLLASTGTLSDIEDPDKFSVRMAFFQYMEPEARLWLLERRKNYLQERLQEMKGFGKSGRYRDETDSYRIGMFRHRIELTEYDIAWLDGLIEQERAGIDRDKKSGAKNGSKSNPKNGSKNSESKGGVKRAAEIGEARSKVSPGKA
jgi:DNA-binding PadR family transcriptional regulator